MSIGTRFSGRPAFHDMPAPIAAATRQTARARCLQRLVQGADADAALSPNAVATVLGRNAYDLVRQSAECRHLAGLPMNERLQAHLRNIVKVLDLGFRIHGEIEKTLHWYRHSLVAELGNRTPEWCALNGEIETLCRLLQDRSRHNTRNATTRAR
jgi:hypothetical protein